MGLFILLSKSLSRALYDKIFSGFYFNCYSSLLEDLQTHAHKADITDKTKLMNPIVMTISVDCVVAVNT